MTRRELLVSTAAVPLFAAPGPMPENRIIFREEGRYGGWPANHGIWSWGPEIVVGFTAAWFQHDDTRHAVDRSKKYEDWQARSLDSGVTWKIEKPDAIVPPENGGPKPKQLADPVDFTARGFALCFRMRNSDVGPSQFYLSRDKCRTWDGPFTFSVDGDAEIATRTDYIVLGKRECIMFGSGPKSNKKEGRPFCAKTIDGGLTWKLLGRIGPEPVGYAIMPSTVRLGRDHYFTTVRHSEPGKGGVIDAYRSTDGGKTWAFEGTPAPNIGTGNPPSLLRLRDGRLALSYGFRAKPFGVRARVSKDQGKSWGEEIVLRDDALSGDLGYPRSVELPDGKVLTAYYWNGPRDEDRPIAATVWKP